MKLRPIDALKFFFVLFPALVAVEYTLSMSALSDRSLTEILLRSALFSMLFALFYTAYRKPKK